MEAPKIAYLILAHGQEELLLRLIDTLNGPNINFFIHLDKKSTKLNFLKAALQGKHNVTIISSYKIYWMGFNMVRSTLELLQKAQDSKVNFKYFVLLSGQDYPIKSNSYINNFFTSHSEDFISYNKMADMEQKIRNKFQFFHYLDAPWWNPRHNKRIAMLIKIYYGFHKYISKRLPLRSFYNNMEPYFGSQWFALTHETVSYILEFVAKESEYLKFSKYTEGADEFFFQTIILNSQRKYNLYDYDSYEKWLVHKKENELYFAKYTSLRYMDWSEAAKTKPAVLNMNYYDVLKSSDELFARKFDLHDSSKLLDRIDEIIEKNNT
jgi:hypothetical protein